MMRRILILLSVIISFTGPALGAGDAFISLRDGGSNAWGRDIALQEILKDKLGFNSVNLNNDATPSEIASRAAKFLARRGEPGDRRLVWVNGLSESSDSPCPSISKFVIRPSVPTLMLAPDCFAEFLEHKSVGLHVSLRGLPLTKPSQIIEKWSKVPPLVFIALPSDNEEIILDANKLILGILQEAISGYVSPSTILQRLRYELTSNGSNFTPSLEAFPAPSAWTRRFLTPGIDLSKFQMGVDGATKFEARLRWSKGSSFGLYAEPHNLRTPSIWLKAKTPVTVIRLNRGEDMGFVKTGDDLFGWVKLDALD